METTEKQINLGALPIGARLIVKCRNDWRGAVVSSIADEKITLIVCSSSGGTYRLRRLPDTPLVFDGKIPLLQNGCEDDWRENFTKYDTRW